MDTAGSSFSYWDGATFTLIEARCNQSNAAAIFDELKVCGKDRIDMLHITSWDQDHCVPDELRAILKVLRPTIIEVPRYYPRTESALQALREINTYKTQLHSLLLQPSTVTVDSQYVASLPGAVPWDTKNILFDCGYEDANNFNNNSTIKLFRSGRFSVLSVGDIESANIANWLVTDSIIQNEVDILILAHHGADNGFTTSELIAKINPKIAICSSNYDNQYEHPKSEIRSILQCANVPLMTTKTGDVIIAATSALTGQFTGFNLGANSTALLSSFSFSPKKMRSPLENFRSNSSTSQLLFGGVSSNSLLGRI
jgi:competence protein ComEC